MIETCVPTMCQLGCLKSRIATLEQQLTDANEKIRDLIFQCCDTQCDNYEPRSWNSTKEINNAQRAA